MPTYEYQARTKEGEPRSGLIETSSEEAALENLQRNNLIVIYLKGLKKKALFEYSIGGGVRQKDVVVFSRQLATLFEAKIPVVETLKTLISETSRPALREAIAEILDDISGGLALSQALAKHPSIFSSFYIYLVRSGEESGKLQEVFTYLADYTERSYYLTNKARNSMIYPAFVLFAFMGVLIVMLTVVIPRLVTIFQETGQKVPYYTQIIIYISLFLRKWGLILLLLLIGSVVGLWRWSYNEKGKLFFHRLQINLPIIGEIYRKLYMTRLTDNLRTLIMGGIPILRALSITGDVVGNVIYQKALMNAVESVKAGSTISGAFEKTKEIPLLVTQMIRVGEVSGRLDFILGSIAKFYQREVDAALENMVSLIEPALIIFLGVGIGILVASVLVPLYNLVGSI